MRDAVLARPELTSKTAQAVADLGRTPSLARKCDIALDAVEDGAVAICMPPDVLKGITLNGTNYLSHYKLAQSELIKEWDKEHHAARSGVDSWLFGGYKDSICFGSLTPNAAGSFEVDGETEYGACTVHIVPDVYEDRISFFIEDSLHFYENFCDAHNHTKVGPPAETRPTWSDRGALASIKLAGCLNESHSDADATRLVGSHDPKGTVDRGFIEAHIFGSVNLSAIAAVRLSVPLTTADDQMVWQRIEETLTRDPSTIRVTVSPRAQAKSP